MSLALRLLIERRPPRNTLSVLALPLSLGMGVGVLAPSPREAALRPLPDSLPLTLLAFLAVAVLAALLARFEVRPLLVLLYFSTGLLGKTATDDSLAPVAEMGCFRCCLWMRHPGPGRTVWSHGARRTVRIVPSRARWRGRYPCESGAEELSRSVSGLSDGSVLDPRGGPPRQRHPAPEGDACANRAPSWTRKGSPTTDALSGSRPAGNNCSVGSVRPKRAAPMSTPGPSNDRDGRVPEGLASCVLLCWASDRGGPCLRVVREDGTSHLLAISGLYVGLSTCRAAS